MSDTLTFKFPPMEGYAQSSRLEVSFSRISTDELSVSISAPVGTFRNSAGPLELAARTLCYGYDLAEFAREIEQLHTLYESTARFVNQVGSFERTAFLLSSPATSTTQIACLLRSYGAFDWSSPICLACFRTSDVS